MATSISGTQGVDKVKDGVVGTAALAPGAATPEKSSGFPFTKSYESAEQTVSNAGQLILPHGLGGAPRLVQLLLVCKAAEAGYSIGDVVALYDGAIGNSNDGMSVIYGTVNITVRYGAVSGPIVMNASTGLVTRLTPANWRLVVRAWA